MVAVLNGEPRPPKGGFDLRGEKLIDWGWICVNLPKGPKRALEIGPGESPIIPAMLSLGYEVTAVDPWAAPTSIFSGFRFVQEDFDKFSWDRNFDVVIVCSVVEHIGLAGRYNAQEDVDGDLKTMQRIRHLLEPNGSVLLTIPVGLDAVHKPWHRVYGRDRLPRLLEGFEVMQSRFLRKEPEGAWHCTTQEQALNTAVDVRRYALGEMILSRTE
jgi:hypothetical protein